MSQFDVYKNPSTNTQQAFPFILDIQHEHISDIGTRIVLPLGRLKYFRNENLGKLTPIIEYDGEELLILTPQIASMPTSKLKNPVGTLEHIRAEILAALDFAITGI
ncbi:plasmid maintenance protein CcdB [Microbulbifer sp. SH-1]|uniref:CcdB family protein n=1 Tax=Microbulbifer sp. SH-1 TaxID=2681547 RepID=UPI00140980AA|nr:CcdB family protein [Microbulbifer sp. SH-1]QIL88810.1 plasmid maintenance protein CcdB [Microbulbifer sp. SH-1]